MEHKYEALMKVLLEAVQTGVSAGGSAKSGAACTASSGWDSDEIPVGVSNRHIHLSQADLDTLFGAGFQLTRLKDLSQPGQYACKESVILCGPKGAIEGVRILGPVRKQTQVEILTGDGFKLGVQAPARLSGDLAGTPGLTVAGPKGSVQLKEGVITAHRHIHMTLADAKRFGVTDGQIVSILQEGACGGVYHNVMIRANDSSALECHLDTEEANAMKLSSNSKIKLIKK